MKNVTTDATATTVAPLPHYLMAKSVSTFQCKLSKTFMCLFPSFFLCVEQLHMNPVRRMHACSCNGASVNRMIRKEQTSTRMRCSRSHRVNIDSRQNWIQEQAHLPWSEIAIAGLFLTTFPLFEAKSPSAKIDGHGPRANEQERSSRWFAYPEGGPNL